MTYCNWAMSNTLFSVPYSVKNASYSVRKMSNKLWEATDNLWEIIRGFKRIEGTRWEAVKAPRQKRQGRR